MMMMMLWRTLVTRFPLTRAAAASSLSRRTLQSQAAAAEPISASLEAEERPNDAEIISALRNAILKPLWTNEAAKELDEFCSVAKPRAYHISEALKIHRNVNVALGFFIWARQQPWYVPNPYVYTILINSLGRISDLKLVEELLESMKSEGCAFTTFTYNSIIKIFGKAKRLDDVSRVYTEMREAGCKPDSFSFTTLISVFHNAGLPEKVVEFYDEMVEGEHPLTELIFEMVIPSLAKVGKLERACKVFEEMLEKGFKPNATLYFTVIIYLAKAGKLERGMKFYESMKNAGHKPGLGTYCALIESHAKSGRLELAMRLYEDMQAADFKPNLSLYSTLIESYVKTRNIEVAMRFYNQMCSIGLSPPLHIYAALVDLMVRADRPDIVVHLYKGMRDAGLRPGRDTLKQVISAMARCSSPKDAEEVLMEMNGSGFMVDTLLMEALMSCLDEGNIASGGLLFLKAQALRIQPDIRVFRQLLHGLIEERMYGAANRVIASMLDSAGAIDLRSYCVIFKHFIKCSEDQREKPLLKLMRKTKHPAHLFLCELFGSLRQAQPLMEFVNAFYNSSTGNADLKTRRYFTNLLMNYMVLMGHQSLASGIWKVALEAHIYPDVIQFKTDLVWSLYVKNMSVGTTLIATLCSLESFRERILRRRFVPQRIKILTGLRDDSTSKVLRDAVEEMLRPLDSPFQFNDAPLGCLWCRGASFVKWFRLPYVREILRAKGTLQRPHPLKRF